MGFEIKGWVNGDTKHFSLFHIFQVFTIDFKIENNLRFQRQLEKIMEETNPQTKLPLEAIQEKESSFWLTALPL